MADDPNLEDVEFCELCGELEEDCVCDDFENEDEDEEQP